MIEKCRPVFCIGKSLSIIYQLWKEHLHFLLAIHNSLRLCFVLCPPPLNILPYRVFVLSFGGWPVSVPIKDSLSIASKWKCGQCSSAFLALHCNEMMRILPRCTLEKSQMYCTMEKSRKHWRTVKQTLSAVVCDGDGGASLANMVKNYMSTGFFGRGQASGQIYFQTTLAACICPICKMYLFNLQITFV